MNLSSAPMLVNKSIRPIRVLYDPENQAKSYNPLQLFMTLDPDVKVDDLVIVPTNTRHGFTIAKVKEADFPVDFNSAEQWGWVGGKFDKTTYDEVLGIAAKITKRIAHVQENKMREELRAAAGLGDVDFNDLDLMAPKLASPRGAAPIKEDAYVPPAAAVPPVGKVSDAIIEF